MEVRLYQGVAVWWVLHVRVSARRCRHRLGILVTRAPTGSCHRGRMGVAKPGQQAAGEFLQRCTKIRFSTFLVSRRSRSAPRRSRAGCLPGCSFRFWVHKYRVQQSESFSHTCTYHQVFLDNSVSRTPCLRLRRRDQRRSEKLKVLLPFRVRTFRAGGVISAAASKENWEGADVLL